MFFILLNFGWMVDLAMIIFEFLTKFLVLWHPWHPWVYIRSVCWKCNLKQIEAIPPSVQRPLRDVFFYVLEFTRLWPFPWPSFQKSVLVCSFFQKPRVSVKKRADRGLFCGFLSKIMQTFVSALQIISQMIKYHAGTSLLFVLCPKRCGIYFSSLFCLRKKT